MLNFKNIHSIAIIGASEDPKKIGNILLAKNQAFQGNIYGINPKWWKAYGKDFYPNILSLPEVPDIAVFAIPAWLIYDSLEEAGKFGIKKAIIITAGFKEIGNKEWEDRLIAIAKKYNIRILGPNCLGYGDTHSSLNLSFGSQFFDRGNIGIISQSGCYGSRYNRRSCGEKYMILNIFLTRKQIRYWWIGSFDWTNRRW